MHSLKNTIVAVGLLGLSFLFYQASSNKSPVTDDMIPALEISDGSDSVEQLESTESQSSAGSIQPIEMPKIDAPDLIRPSTIAPEVASDGDGKSPKSGSANDFSSQGFPSIDSAQPKSKPAAPDPSTGLPTDNVARDEGLIDALKVQDQVNDQQQVTATPAPANNSFVSRQPISNESDSSVDSQFKSQSIPSGDSSYNARASDDSKKRDFDVKHADAEPGPSNLSFQAAWPVVDRLIAQKKYKEALKLLSQFYRSTDLNGPQRQRLLPWLDGLAGKVIFSTEHHLEGMPYTVANESLVDIGERWKVPAQLIYNINQKQIANPVEITGGTQLKVVRGPFNAEIDTHQNVMTLFLGDLYAGRFPIRVGISGNPKPGSFRVLVKSEVGHSWRDAEGNDYPPGAPENGYGPHWIGLSGSLCIHAVDESVTDGHSGCIGLNAKDAKDVFAILTDGSNVKILR